MNSGETALKKPVIKILACAVVSEEIRPLLPEGIDFEKLDFGLHQTPENLHKELQKRIDESPDYNYIVLGYGMCGMATVGLYSNTATLVIPKVDDCISIFLGSRDTYEKRQHEFPGSYFLTRGWLDGFEEGQINELSPITEIMKQLTEKYGVERARRIFSVYQDRAVLQNYKRMVFISTTDGNDLEQYREKGRERAERLNLTYEEVKGTDSFLKKLVSGDWDSDFVVVPPGRPVNFDDFKLL
jgi:hypothetical protein